jgi:hypothetical protein
MSGTAYLITQHHIPEDLNLQENTNVSTSKITGIIKQCTYAYIM